MLLTLYFVTNWRVLTDQFYYLESFYYGRVFVSSASPSHMAISLDINKREKIVESWKCTLLKYSFCSALTIVCYCWSGWQLFVFLLLGQLLTIVFFVRSCFCLIKLNKRLFSFFVWLIFQSSKTFSLICLPDVSVI